MSNAKRALSQIATFLKQFKNQRELDEEIAVAGSLENLIAQRRRGLADFKAQIATTGDRLNAADAGAQSRIAGAGVQREGWSILWVLS